MAFATLTMQQPQIGMLKKAPIGFSYTVLFFGLCVPLLRGDFKWALIMLVAAPFTAGISNIVFAFTYNKTYIESLLMQGYRVAAATMPIEIIVNKSQMPLPVIE